MSLSRQLLADNAALWRTWMPHRFTQAVAEGTLPRPAWLRWLAQDYRFVAEGLRFLGALLAKAPPGAVDALAQTLAAWHGELALFREDAGREGADLAAPPAFVTQAYGDFLLSVAYTEPFAVGWAVLFGVECSYNDAWRWAREHAAPDSPYRPWLENWGSDAFGAFVQSLAERLDGLEPQLAPEVRKRMDVRFAQTARFEQLFWEMAWHGDAIAMVP